VRGRAVGRGGGDADEPDEDAQHPGELAAPDALAEDPHSEGEQEEQPECERRLDHGEGRKRERDELERPAQGAQESRAHPERTTHEVPEQREPQRVARRSPASLERLEDVGGVVAACGRGGGHDPEDKPTVYCCEHVAMRPWVLGAFGAASAWCAPAPAAHVPLLAGALGISCRLPNRPGVALTFDDGPHPRGTPAVLETLAESGAIATFFLVGEQVERSPAIAAEIAAQGHEIGLHGYRHRNLLLRTPRALARDLDRAVAVIGETTGREPACYRPPYGVFSTAGLTLARRRGWLPLLWSRWGRDWEQRATPEAIARRATAGLAAGDVVLLHDADHYSSFGSWRNTVAALPSILDAVAALGLPFVPATQEM
jgi:peptidoglycan/xylan/chitin deacetylase (PgdA/CDA1 family)